MRISVFFFSFLLAAVLVGCGKAKRKNIPRLPDASITSCLPQSKVLSADGEKCVFICPRGEQPLGGQCKTVSAANCATVDMVLSANGEQCLPVCQGKMTEASGLCVAAEPESPTPESCKEDGEKILNKEGTECVESCPSGQKPAEDKNQCVDTGE